MISNFGRIYKKFVLRENGEKFGGTVFLGNIKLKNDVQINI